MAVENAIGVEPDPARKREPAEDPAPRSSGGLLDLPDDKPASNGHAPQTTERAAERERPAPPPVNPYMANPAATYSAPALTQYRPPMSRGLMAGLVFGAVTVIALFGLVIWLATREPKVIAAPTPAPVAVAPTPAPAPVLPPPVVAPPSGTNPSAPVAVAPVPAPVAAPVPPVAVAERPSSPGSSHLGGGRPVASKGTSRQERQERQDPPDDPPEKKPAVTAKAESDDFDDAFKPDKEKKPEPAAKKKEVYIPPAPGSGGDIKDELGTADVFQVVLENKASVARCADEQHKKDPALAGKLIMRWSIQTNGRTSNIGVASEEFKGSYIATCIAGLVKTWVFPKHKKQGEPIQFPFKF